MCVFGGLNHLTATGSGFINPCRVVAPHRTAVTPLRPPRPPTTTRTGEHDHMHPAHMGAHVGELEEKLQFQLRMDIFHKGISNVAYGNQVHHFYTSYKKLCVNEPALVSK